jgi:DNA-binding GntR family transcriptional regulator
LAVGEVLFREGERGEEMYVIQSGIVQILKRVGGQDRPLATLGKGDLAAQVGVDRAQVRDVLSRLRRLRVADEDEGGNIVLIDLPRLLEFMEFLEMPGKGEG